MTELHCTDAEPPENIGLYYPGTLVLTQPYSHRHELAEKPGTETTSELSCELHIVQKPQLTIYTSICFNGYNFSCGSIYSVFITIFQAVASVPTSF